MEKENLIKAIQRFRDPELYEKYEGKDVLEKATDFLEEYFRDLLEEQFTIYCLENGDTEEEAYEKWMNGNCCQRIADTLNRWFVD